MGWLLHPRTFNLVIMVLYLLAAIAWGAQRKWADCLYWLFALGLTLVVTFGYER